MSRKYKMAYPDGMYFVSFAVVYWMDVFIREEYISLNMRRYQTVVSGKEETLNNQ